MVQVLREGFRLDFVQHPPLTRNVSLDSASRDPSRMRILSDIVLDLLAKEAVEPVENPTSPGFYSRIFFVPKKSGGHRPIIDLSVLNLSLVVPKFKMESVHSIRNALQEGSFTFSIDLKDAYFQIPIHRSSRKYLRFSLGGRAYQFKALPFGLSSAPWLFTKVMREVKRIAHRAGLSIFQYLDDWLGQSPSELQASTESQLLLRLCLHLGLKVNFDKSELIPTKSFVFLGVGFDLALGLVKPTLEHLQEILQLINLFLQSHNQPAVMWQSLIGSLVAQEKFIHLGRFHLRPLQWHLSSHWNQVSDPQSRPVPITSDIKPVLRWWADSKRLSSGVPLHWPAPSLRVFTDASTQGWGAHCHGRTFEGLWSPQESLLHINILEMRAVRLALAEIQPAASQLVLVATDNSTVVAYINKQGGLRSSYLWQETCLLFQLLQRLNFTLRARHIPGKLNVIADQLSRRGQVLPTEWTLRQDLVEMIFHHWSRPLVDLFATRYTRRLPSFVSPVPDPEALEVDALSISWENLDAYAYPPHVILTSVLRKFRETKVCRLLLVAPRIETFSWFPSLQELAVDSPLPLPQSRTMLAQPQSSLFHYDPGTLNLHAWLLQKPY